MIDLRVLRPKKTERGGAVTAATLPGRRVTLSPPVSLSGARTNVRNKVCNRVCNQQRGFSLIELVITITVLTILTLGVVPLMKLSVKRQKEQRLHEALRQMRLAIDDFHRDTVDMTCTGTAGATTGGTAGTAAGYVDPRSKVKISDCTIFGVDNPDRYPPDLETLVNGVNVIPRGGLGGRGDIGVDATKVGDLATKKKIYLRSIPIDPMTGEPNWEFRSCYDASDSGSWGGENVFDVRSKSKETALNGEKYNEW